MTTNFIITNDTAATEDRVIVVQPTILDLDSTATLFDWQVLTPGSGGGSAQFTWTGAIQVDVSDGQTRTARVTALPGFVLPLVASLNGGLSFAVAIPSDDPEAASVRNDTEKRHTLTVTWYVDDSPLMSEGGLNQQSTATLKLSRDTLFFRLRAPLATAGRAMLAAEAMFSPVTTYTIPADASDVTVKWSRSNAGARDVLTFDPPSAA